MITTSVAEAAECLKQGHVLAYPTEAVWGLGCDTFNELAFLEIFRQTIPLKKILKRAQTNRSIGARNHYSFFFPLFYNILISILQGFRILEGLFTLKKLTLASLAPFQNLIQRID